MCTFYLFVPGFILKIYFNYNVVNWNFVKILFCAFPENYSGGLLAPRPLHLLIIFNFRRWNLSKFLTCSSNICKNIIEMGAYWRPSIPPLSTPDISRHMRYFKSTPIKILHILKFFALFFCV